MAAPGAFIAVPSGGTRAADDTVASPIAAYRGADASKVAERLDTEELDLLRQANGAPACRGDPAP
jgi:hypothetical protein